MKDIDRVHERAKNARLRAEGEDGVGVARFVSGMWWMDGEHTHVSRREAHHVDAEASIETLDAALIIDEAGNVVGSDLREHAPEWEWGQSPYTRW